MMTKRETSSARLHLRITPTAEWKLRSGHPWLYADSLLEQNRAGELGELAVIYDRHNNFLAIGLYDPDSPLLVRVLLTGKPEPINPAWWRTRFASAIHRREGLFDTQTTGYRCINGESDGWPGLVLDRYGATLVLKLYTAAWLPRLEEVTGLIREELLSNVIPSSSSERRGEEAPIMSPHRLVLRLSRNIQSVARRKFQLSDGQLLQGPALDRPVVFLETGLQFEADVVHGQKTGFFLDQRENRRLIEPMASGGRVLNLFSFSGAFSVYAARGGAVAVSDVDISAHALESARRNFDLNRAIPAVASCRHETVQADVFEWLGKQVRPEFDLVILDPPSLARREVERSGAIQAYGQLARQAIGCVRSSGGALVAASCSAHVSRLEFYETIRQAASNSGRAFEEIQITGHPPDHPATFAEANYLKCIFMRSTSTHRQ